VEKGVCRQALYVGCSRARTLSGLYIEGKFKAPRCSDDDPVEAEMKKISQRKLILEGLENPKEYILNETSYGIEDRHPDVDQTQAISVQAATFTCLESLTPLPENHVEKTTIMVIIYFSIRDLKLGCSHACEF
jgi:hypothetical protein